MTEITHFINGQPVNGAGPTLDDIDPATGRVIARLAEATEEQVADAVEAASRSFFAGEWSDTPVSYRQAVLRGAARAIRDDIDTLVDLQVSEGGMPPDGMRGLVRADGNDVQSEPRRMKCVKALRNGALGGSGPGGCHAPPERPCDGDQRNPALAGREWPGSRMISGAFQGVVTGGKSARPCCRRNRPAGALQGLCIRLATGLQSGVRCCGRCRAGSVRRSRGIRWDCHRHRGRRAARVPWG